MRTRRARRWPTTSCCRPGRKAAPARRISFLPRLVGWCQRHHPFFHHRFPSTGEHQGWRDGPMKIVFRCDPALETVLPKPLPAQRGLPDWLRAMKMTEFSEFHGKEIRTVKQCPPFVDALMHGFLIPLPCDVAVDRGRFSWDWGLPEPSVPDHARAPLSFHVAAQLAGSPLAEGERPAIKFNTFWTIELEPGWSILALHPVNRLDLPFR